MWRHALVASLLNCPLWSLLAPLPLPASLLSPSLRRLPPLCPCTLTGRPPTPRPSRALQECHCMLFLTEDNDFRGEEQNITLDELVDMTKDM